MNANAALFDATNAPALAPPVASPGSMGGISGGLLRPGSIDQAAFARELAAQQAARAAAGVGGLPVPMAPRTFQIPTLSPAQFAALVGSQTSIPGTGDPTGYIAGSPAEGLAGDPQSGAAATAQASAMAAYAAAARSAVQPAPMATPVRLTGLRAPLNAAPLNASPLNAAQAAQPATTGDQPPSFSRAGNAAGSGAQTASAETGDDAPTFSRSSDPVQTASTATDSNATGADTSDAAKASSSDAKPAPSDPNLVHLKNPPDKDQQKELRLAGKRWVVDETPGARQLFFGPDGKFGWDDFLDLINPLQHIPIVAQIYRAVTGDQAYGASELLGAIPMGPLGGISLLGAVADIAVKDTTGKDIGGNIEAMLFGNGKTDTTPAGADMAATQEDPATSTQTASRAGFDSGFNSGTASLRHEDCRG